MSDDDIFILNSLTADSNISFLQTDNLITTHNIAIKIRFSAITRLLQSGLVKHNSIVSLILAFIIKESYISASKSPLDVL